MIFLIFSLSGFVVLSTYAMLVIKEDFVQFEYFKIMFIHVPFAWTMLWSFLLCTVFAVLTELRYYSGFFFISFLMYVSMYSTLIVLFSGIIWAYPVWRSYWVLDVRLLSVLILLVMIIMYNILEYVGYGKYLNIYLLVCFVNLPIIKFGVDWWSSLHQSSSISISGLSIDYSILVVLFFWFVVVMIFNFLMYYYAKIIKP